MTADPWTTFNPLDLRCDDCHSCPGIRCTWVDRGTVRSRQPHPARVSAARAATARARRRATHPPPGWSVWPPPPGST